MDVQRRYVLHSTLNSQLSTSSLRINCWFLLTPHSSLSQLRHSIRRDDPVKRLYLSVSVSSSDQRNKELFLISPMHFFRQRQKSKKSSKHETKCTGGIKADLVKENAYFKELQKLKRTIPCWDIFYTAPEQDRIDSWLRLEILGAAMCEKYSWAIPDSTTLRILKHFSPLIEIGAGKGYIAKLLKDEGADIVAFDREVDKTSGWTKVEIGGPEKLSENAAAGRNLFLCYPDEDSSMANPCLDNFIGDYVVHIGELISTGQISSPQAPWGRTSSADFQTSLMTDFHCVLVYELPAFPFSRDCITVWKRTEFVRGKESIDEELGDGDGDEINPENASEEGSERDDAWASIPQKERLPVTRSSPDFAHLLQLVAGGR